MPGPEKILQSASQRDSEPRRVCRRRINPSCWPQARARRAATGRAACELWGLCARPPAIEIGPRGHCGLLFRQPYARETANNLNSSKEAARPGCAALLAGIADFG